MLIASPTFRGIHTTAHFNSKIFNLKGDGPHIWHSDPLQNFMFDEQMLSFGADNMTITLNEEGDAYTIKSTVNPDSIVAQMVPMACTEVMPLASV